MTSAPRQIKGSIFNATYQNHKVVE